MSLEPGSTAQPETMSVLFARNLYVAVRGLRWRLVRSRRSVAMFKLSRPSPAMVVACLALAISFGGTGYAALKLPRNSVGTKQLQKNAVTAAKIRNDAVTGSK